MNYYKSSRLTKKEEKKAYRKIFFAIAGSFLLFIFIIFYGLPALINMAVFISNLQGKGEVQINTGNTPIPPPSLDAPFEATRTATINITGSGMAGMVTEVFVNATSFKRVLIPKNGNFKVDNIKLVRGENKIWAYTENSVHQKSERSKILTIIYQNNPPKIEVTDPSDGAVISNETKSVTVSGMTEDGITVTVNGRFVIVDTDNKFSYDLPLEDGENTITIAATDVAGNTTRFERKVNYQSP